MTENIAPLDPGRAGKQRSSSSDLGFVLVIVVQTKILELGILCYAEYKFA